MSHKVVGDNVVCDKVVGDKVVSERFACETMSFQCPKPLYNITHVYPKKVVLGGASEPT